MRTTVPIFAVVTCVAMAAHAGCTSSRGEPPAVDAGPASPPGADGGAAGEPSAPAGVRRVWALHDGDKIAEDDLDSPLAAHNAAWDGARAHLFAARNEVVALQIVVEAGDAGISALSAHVDDFVRRGGGATIAYAPPGADPTAYAGRPIQLFVEHYMNVTAPTDARWLFPPGSAAAPAHGTGLVPVQLVPENARADRGGLPIDVPPRRNQALWLDVYVDRALPSGTYDGAVRIRSGGGERVVPIALEVLDFALPDASSLRTMIYFEEDQVELYQGANWADRYHRFAHRQRVELVNAETIASLGAPGGRFDPAAFTRAAGYAGPGEGVPDRIAPATFYGADPPYDQRETTWPAADAWMTAVRARPGTFTFLYAADEPRPPDYPELRRIAEDVKSDPGPGAALPIFSTTAYAPELDGAVDVWCPLPGSFDPSTVAAQHARGRQTWFYNGTRPASGALLIDAPATDARVQAWAAFAGGADGYFYWHADHWRHNRQKQGERNQDVWANPITFDNRGQPNKPPEDIGFANGDGVLVYPGTEKLHPEEDRGIDGPVSTIQLANLRRGIQDHAYLTIARQRGLELEVQVALALIVPRVLSKASGAVAFPEHGDPYEIVRRALAEAIVHARAAAPKP